jgi:hypothetical protein
MALEEVKSVHSDSSVSSESESEEEDPNRVPLPPWTNHLMYFPPTECGQVSVPWRLVEACVWPSRDGVTPPTVR